MPVANFGSNGVVYVEPASSTHKASGSDVRRVRLTHDSNGNVGFLAVGSVPRNISLPDLTDMLIETFDGSGVPQSRKTYSVADLVATGPFNDSDPQAALCGNAPKTGSAMAFDAAEMPNGDLVVLAHTNIRAVWAPQGCPVNSPLTQSYLDVIPVLVRMTPSLTLLWAKSVGRFSGIDFDTPMAMVGDGFVIAGNDATNANNNVPARVIKTNFSGDVTWQGNYIIPGNKNNCVFGLTSTFDDGVVFAGNNDAGGQDYFATKIGSLRDLWSSDNTSTDPGPEPDNATPALWASDDIWVHTSQDQWPYTPQHENPEYRDPSLQLPNFVYVRVRNRGTLPASGLVTVHWAKASTGLAWPTNWQQPTARCCSTNVICGDALQPVAVVGIPPGGEQIVELPWFPPNPADFSDVSCGLEAGHFCLLARIETSPGVSPFGMTYPEGTDVYTNAALNNNIVWKNVTVVDNLPGGQLAGGFVRNISDRDEVIELSFTAPRTTAGSLFDVATVDVKLGTELLALWRRGGAKGSGIRQIDDVTIRITAAGATLQNIAMRPQQAVPYAVRITPKPKTLQRTAMSLDVTQSTTRPATNPPRRQPSKPAGGMRFTLKPPAKRPQ